MVAAIAAGNLRRCDVSLTVRRRRRPGVAASARDVRKLHCPTVEAFFATLLVLSGVFITWFTVYVVYKLYKGQS
jgi:hypothetical protein